MNKYLGHKDGLIGPVTMEKPEPVVDQFAEEYWLNKIAEYQQHLSTLPVIPCEGWTPEVGKEYVKGVDFYLQHTKPPHKVVAVPISHTNGVVVLLPIPVKESFDTIANCWVYSNEQYNISGYGKTRIEAYEMFYLLARDALVYKSQSESTADVLQVDEYDFKKRWELSFSKDKPFFVNNFRDLLNQYDNEEISMSKLVEELNLTAYKWREQSPILPAGGEGAIDLTLKEFDAYFEALYKNEWVKDAGNLWIAFTDKWKAFKKQLLQSPTYPAEFVEWMAQHASRKGEDSYLFYKSAAPYSKAMLYNYWKENIKSQSK